MSNPVPCTNPAHGVTNHVAGSAAASECQRSSPGGTRSTPIASIMIPSIGTSSQSVTGSVTAEDWEARLRSAQSSGDEADDYERTDPMHIGLLAIQNGGNYDVAARIASTLASSTHAPGVPWSGGNAPAWAWGESRVEPKGTYQGDEDLKITSFKIEGSIRSNFMVSTGRIGKDVYIEQPDLKELFDAIAMANAQSAPATPDADIVTSLGTITDPKGARRLSTKLGRGYDDAVTKELAEATPEERAAAADHPEASAELKRVINGPPIIPGYDPSKIEGSGGNRTYWRDDPAGTGAGPKMYQHVSGSVIEARGYRTSMAWNQHGKNLGEFKTIDEAQLAVEADAIVNPSAWRYLDVLSRNGQVSGMGPYSAGDDFTM